jgi:hypothetical protein
MCVLRLGERRIADGGRESSYESGQYGPAGPQDGRRYDSEPPPAGADHGSGKIALANAGPDGPGNPCSVKPVFSPGGSDTQSTVAPLPQIDPYAAVYPYEPSVQPLSISYPYPPVVPPPPPPALPNPTPSPSAPSTTHTNDPPSGSAAGQAQQAQRVVVEIQTHPSGSRDRSDNRGQDGNRRGGGGRPYNRGGYRDQYRGGKGGGGKRGS